LALAVFEFPCYRQGLLKTLDGPLPVPLLSEDVSEVREGSAFGVAIAFLPKDIEGLHIVVDGTLPLALAGEYTTEVVMCSSHGGSIAGPSRSLKGPTVHLLLIRPVSSQAEELTQVLSKLPDSWPWPPFRRLPSEANEPISFGFQPVECRFWLDSRISVLHLVR